MQLAVLVDRPLDPGQQATRLEIGKMFLEIRGRALS